MSPDSKDDPLEGKTPCWLVWQRADDGGRPYLVAVDTSEAKANLHKIAILDGARVTGKVAMVLIEQSWLNHLYGESQGREYDEMKKLITEMKGRGP